MDDTPWARAPRAPVGSNSVPQRAPVLSDAQDAISTLKCGGNSAKKAALEAAHSLKWAQGGVVQPLVVRTNQERSSKAPHTRDFCREPARTMKGAMPRRSSPPSNRASLVPPKNRRRVPIGFTRSNTTDFASLPGRTPKACGAPTEIALGGCNRYAGLRDGRNQAAELKKGKNVASGQLFRGFMYVPKWNSGIVRGHQ